MRTTTGKNQFELVTASLNHVLPTQNSSTPWPPLEQIWTGHSQPKLDMFKSQDVELIYVHFYLSDLDKLYIKMNSLMCRF